jgi:sulfur-oxidizing protein SoxZ
MVGAKIQVPAEARRGEAIEIRLLIRHPMETGFRRDEVGNAIPKNVINQVVCRYNGTEVFRAELGSGIAANPYLAFYTVAQETGEIEFSWSDDAGVSESVRAALTVSG